LLSLSACVSTPAPISPTVEQNQNVPVATEVLPITTPSTRTAPTLPPVWTETFTPTPSSTPTATVTPTPTATFSAAQVCEGLENSLALMEDVTVRNDEGLRFVAGLEAEDAALTLRFQRRGSDTPSDEAVIPGGNSFLLNVGVTYEPGIYDWTISVTSPVYEEICQDEGSFEVIAPDVTSTPEQSLLGELLDVFSRRLFPTTATQTLTPTPTAE
jgi:hypothetical protein